MKNDKLIFDKVLKKYQFFADKKNETAEYILPNLKYEIKNRLVGAERRKAINYCINTFGNNSLPAYWVTFGDDKAL